MARSKSKRKNAAARRPAIPAAGPIQAPRPATSQVGAQSAVRSLEMTLAPRPQAQRGQRGRFQLETTDPAIPLDRVPYFTSDLRNLGVVAVLMVVLLFIGSRLIPLVVH